MTQSVNEPVVDEKPIALSRYFFEDAQTLRTLRNIRRALTTSLKNKYNIEDDAKIDSFLKIHGLHRDFFDFIKNIEKVINARLNDVSVDDNSNKNEKTISGIIKEITTSVDKAVGYDYLYRTAKELYGKDEAQRLMGELYDFSLGLNDSSKILMPYSYYENTPIIVKINDKISYITFKKLYEMFKHCSVTTKTHSEIITKNIKSPLKVFKSMIRGININKIVGGNTFKENIVNEKFDIKVFDGKNGWVNISRIIKHPNTKDFILYVTDNGDFAMVTEDHPVYMEDGSEKEAGKLVDGDKIIKESFREKVFSRYEISPDLAYVIGFVLGDGNAEGFEIDYKHFNEEYGSITFTKGRNLLTVYQNDVKNSHIVKNIFPKIFDNFKFSGFAGKAKSDRSIYLSSAEFTYFYSVFCKGGFKSNSFDKSLPENFLYWDKESQEALIAGLIDSDGSIFKESGRIDIRMQSYAIINMLYDVLVNNDTVKGVNKRVQGENITSLIYGIAFRIVDGCAISKYSEKVKLAKAENPSLFITYNEKQNHLAREHKIVKIIRFNINDIKTTRFLKNDIENVYDITTDTGSFYANGMKQHNCYAIDASKIVVDGRKFGVLPSAPAKRVASYISALCETIHQMSNHVAGAIAVGTLFLDVAHILVYKQKECLDTLKTDASLRKEIENEFQQFVHSVNHLSRNAAESPFTNISIFDRPKLRGLLNDDNMKWYMPYDEALLKSIFGDSINEENYIESIIEYILELQRIFLGFFNEGDPMNGRRQYRFPVVTVNVSKKYHKDGTAYVEDTSFLKEVCKLEIYRYNIFSSEGSKVASCCRLVNNVELMQYASQSNSFGGSAVSLGSHRVVTVNFNRIANECSSYEDYYTILKGRINDAAKILKAHKELILQLEHKGLQPFITNGWISMRKMFSTIGILGVNEAVETMRKRFNGSLVGKDLIYDILKFTNDELNVLASTYGLAFNTEQIPGESFAVRLAKADKFIYGDEKVPYQMYANQFVPLWQEATIMERMSEDGKYNKLMTGGAIVHFTLGEKTTSKQNEKLIKYAIGAGCEHFALNAVVSECENHHNTFGKFTVCPVCQKNIVEYYTRVVGFFTPVSSWNETRREWEFPKRVVKSIADIDHVMSDSALD